MIARRLVISGRVQGVFYRGWLVETARALGVAGWVRNRSGGEVEAFVVGAPESVAALVERCREGPAAARVSAVAVEEADPVPADGFHQRPTL